MTEIDLILKEIQEKHPRENFARLKRYLNEEAIILHGNWKLYEKTFDSAVTNFKMAHGLDFIPTDIIRLSEIGDRNVYFNFDKFTLKNFDISANGAVKIRFLAGSYKERLDGSTSSFVDKQIGINPPPTPSPLSEVIKTMDCLAGLAVNDWVYQSTSTDNFAVKATDNTNIQPVIGIVKAKPTSVTADVLLFGIYSGLTISSRGTFWLGTSGTHTTSIASTGYIQVLGQSFGNNEIHVKPEYHRLRRAT